MSNRTLHVKVGNDPKIALQQFSGTLKALDRGESPEPYFSIRFTSVGQLFAVFTPRRWELLATLRRLGPTSIAQLARALSRDYKNVHTDIERLREWSAVAKDAQGRVFAPYSEISVDVHLPDREAA